MAVGLRMVVGHQPAVKPLIRAAISLQARKAFSCRAVVGGETSTDDDLPIGLKGGGPNKAICRITIPKPHIGGVEGGVDGAGLG